MLDRYFRIREHGSTVSREVLAGVTTFLAMAYIVAVNPGILGDELLGERGMPAGAVAIATCLAAAVGTLLMGFYARRPLAIAPYMGENAFIAYTVILGLGYTWQQGLAAVCVGGVLFIILTLSGLRGALARAVPPGLRYSFVVGIGLFLAFIGLEKIGFVVHGTPGGPPVALGNLSEPASLLGVGGFLVMGLAILWRLPGGILGVIVLTFLAGNALSVGASGAPAVVNFWHWETSDVVAIPDLGALDAIASLWPATTWKLDFSLFGTPSFLLAVFLPVFLMDFFDTIGTLIGVSARAVFLDEEGNLPQIEKPMLCDAVASVWGALVGSTTTGTYIESAAGVEAGGRTGLTSVVTGLLFILALFFAPFFRAIPGYAYAPALVIVGILMMQSVTKIEFGDFTELIPAFSVIVLIPFTYNIGVGMAAGFILHPLLKCLTGRPREITIGGLIFAFASLLFFINFPYGGS